jgi:hypothetical protein
MRSIRALIREKWGSESVELRDINTLITSVDEARLAEREKGRLLEQHKGE